jgi:hypothetical protein
LAGRRWPNARVEAREDVAHEDDARVGVQHVEPGGDERGERELPLHAHALHVPLKARGVPRVDVGAVVG